MKHLIQHITRLVSRNNFVVMPGVGAFVAHNISARYNIKEQIFTPPYRTISFNPEVKVDDALLLSAYMEHDNLSYQQAEQKMNKDISKLRRVLSTKGVVQFGELGSFSMDINNSVMFEASANGIDDPENFGFQPLFIETLRNQSDKVITIKRKELSRYIAVAAAIVLMFLFVTPISDRIYDGNIKASLSGFASSEQISMMQQLTAYSPKQVVAEPNCEIVPVGYSATKGIVTTNENVADKPAIGIEPKNEVNTVVAVEANIENKAPQADVLQAEVGLKYYIIVASSPSEENAMLAVKELTAKHQAEYNVVKCGKRHRISIASFCSEKEAQSNLLQYQKIFPDAWVLTH